MIEFVEVGGARVFIHKKDIHKVEITLKNEEAHALLVIKGFEDKQFIGRYGIRGNRDVLHLTEQLRANNNE